MANSSSDSSPGAIHKVTFEYIKSPLFRATHADGLVGGLTPAGNIHVAFFNERLPVPRKVTHLLNDNGTLGPPTLEGFETREGVIREMDVNVIMTVETAESLATWLTERVAQAKQLREKGK